MEKIYKIVSEALKMSEEDVRKNCKRIEDINAYYFWNSERGGNALIINLEGEKLGATSAVSFEEHLAAFKNGIRN